MATKAAGFNAELVVGGGDGAKSSEGSIMGWLRIFRSSNRLCCSTIGSGRSDSDDRARKGDFVGVEERETEDVALEVVRECPTASRRRALLQASSRGSRDDWPGLSGGGSRSAKIAAPTESSMPSPWSAEACSAKG